MTQVGAHVFVKTVFTAYLRHDKDNASDYKDYHLRTLRTQKSFAFRPIGIW
jgi:hypothetical protein